MTGTQSSFTKKRLAMVLAGGIHRSRDWACGGIRDRDLTRNVGVDATCRPAVELAKKIAPLARGEVAAVNVAKSPLRIPDLAFQDLAGKPLTLANWHGRTVLLDLWATMVARPVARRCPHSIRWSSGWAGPGLEVVTVNIDTRDADKPKAWLNEIGVQKLAYFAADPTARVFQDLKAIGRAFGMPTTLLIDPQGCEIATIAGPAEWASEVCDQAHPGRARTIAAVRLTSDVEICPTPAATLARLAMLRCAALITSTMDAALSAFIRTIFAATAICALLI